MLKQKILIGISVCLVLLTACGGTDETSTPDMASIQTAAVGTVLAIQTQTGAAAPSPTVELLPTLTATETVISLPPAEATLPVPSQPTLAPTKSCYSMAFVSDVTIPDNTPVFPGQTFTKTWKVINNGSCAWDAGFKFVNTGGDAMNGVTYTLPAAVAVNATIELSIVMKAPTNKSGTVRSNWRMTTADGKYFGDEVFVVIMVGTSTVTPSATATATATATSQTYP